VPISPEAATDLLEAAGFTPTAELIGALQQACENRHETRASMIINRLQTQPPDRDTILRLNEQIDRQVVRQRRR
jgi:hypothetical protein